ncbi:transcriptional regulator NrdR [candidate division KSB1 bacterium]
MKCPYCSSMEDKVIDSRLVKEGAVIRRRRECLECVKRFTTYEYIEKISHFVIKNDGRREEFDRTKLERGIRLSVTKRPISIEKINEIINKIEERIVSFPGYEIPSKVIGEIVMDELKKLDPIAYVRFASVYRKFQDKEEFLKEIEELKE